MVYDEVPVLDDVPPVEDAPPPAPEPEAEAVEETAVPEEAEPAAPVQVVTVADLLDALTANVSADGEDEPEEETLEGEETPEEPVEAVAGELSEDETGPSQAELAFQLLAEIRQDVAPHPLLTTPFSEYTVTEGLLLLALLYGVVSLCVRMLKGGFSWLLW